MAQMPTLKEHAYQLILDKLCIGDSPPGTRLSDEAIAKEIGISRSPVREAINQLASERIVEYRPRRGAFVRVPDLAEIEQLFEARLVLEGYTSGKAAKLAGEESIAELEDINQNLLAVVKKCRQRPSKIANRQLTQRFLGVDVEFHETILRIAGNNIIADTIRDCRILVRLFAHMTMDHDLHLMAHTYRQHATVLRAIRRHRPQAATHWMKYHIQATAKIVLEAFSS